MIWMALILAGGFLILILMYRALFEAYETIERDEHEDL